MPPSPRRRRIRNALVLVGVAAAASVVLALALDRNGKTRGPDVADPERGITDALFRPIPADHPRLVFEEVGAELGITAVHGTGRRGSVLPEDMGPGCALEDLDGDGDLDLFVVNFAGPVTRGDSTTALPPEPGATHRLYRNDGGRFVDVTEPSGAGLADLGIGVAAGDADGDGLLDLYVTCYGKNRLLRNLGDLRFLDVTDEAGVGDTGFSAGAVFGDPDRDGDLDLYVCNYVRFRWNGRPPERSPWGGYSVPHTINPSSFPPAPNRFYRNLGDGRFEEAAAELGIADPAGRSLAATFADFNGDGWPDLYVLNDVSKNAYFESQGDGTFRDRSIDSLAADYRGAMGNAVANFDGDGDLDFFITHWIAQENGLYENVLGSLGTDERGRATFSDVADFQGLGHSGLNFVGWGTAFCDLDLDGLLDLVVVNGSTMEAEEDPLALVPQRPQLFWQRTGEGFFEIGPVSGTAWSAEWNARGLAEGDLDGDGDLDLVVTENRGPVHVLRLQGAPRHHWLGVALRQGGGNPRAVGARVKVRVNGREAMQEIGAGTSYLCHRPLRLTFGLGKATHADRVEVRWPDGAVTVRENVAGDRLLVIPRDEKTREKR